MKPYGIALAFFGSLLQSLGMLVQKKAQNQGLNEDKKMPVGSSGIWDEQDDEEKNGEPDLELPPVPDPTSYLKSNLWRFGFFLHVLGSIMGFLSLSMVGPGLFIIISTFGLVVNLVLSPILLMETSYKKDWLAAAFIISGISMCITAIELSKPKVLTVDEAAALVSRPVAGLIWGSLAALILGLTYACRLKNGTIEPENGFQRSCFIVRAAISATLQVLLSTPSSLLLMDPVHAPKFLWAIFAAMTVNIALDVHFQNRSLRFNDILTHGPISFVVWQILSLSCSALIFRELDGFLELHFILGGVGVGCNLIGVLLSSTRPLPGGYGYMTVNLL